MNGRAGPRVRVPDAVERIGHPRDDVEPVEHAFGGRAPPAGARVDPVGPVAGDDPDGFALSGRQRLEEQVEHVPAVPAVSPDDPMPLVVDDHGQVRVALAVAGLVHADRVQAVERRGIAVPSRSATLWAMSPAILHAICRNLVNKLLLRRSS